MDIFNVRELMFFEGLGIEVTEAPSREEDLTVADSQDEAEDTQDDADSHEAYPQGGAEEVTEVPSREQDRTEEDSQDEADSQYVAVSQD